MRVFEVPGMRTSWVVHRTCEALQLDSSNHGVCANVRIVDTGCGFIAYVTN
jgi:hypothetical protein